MHFNALPLMLEIELMTPAELKAWNDDYDREAARLRKRFPTPRSEAKHLAKQKLDEIRQQNQPVTVIQEKP
jgi:hypothetical protein